MTDKTPAKTRTATKPLGTLWGFSVPEGKTATVQRPDGHTVTVTEGHHVLDVAGSYVAVVGDETHTVQAK